MTIPEVPDWTQLIQLMGQYAGTPTLVAVDANGNIIALMKGEYAGALKTLATDADGRILAVLTDPEDVWGTIKYLGLAELAVRLGSIMSYDRRGSVLFIHDFTAGLAPFTITPGVGGGDFALSSTYADSGPYSVRLTTGNIAGNMTSLERDQYLAVLSKVGFQVSFSLDSKDLYVSLDINLYDGSQYYNFSAWWDRTNDTWYVIDDAGADQALTPTMDLREDFACFHVAKLVVDPSTGKYVRLLCDGKEYDISAYSAGSLVSSDQPHHNCYIMVGAQEADNCTIYVDNFIITHNEPD